MIRFLVVVVLAVGLLAPGAVFAVDPAPRISDHEIIEGLADLNAKYTELKAELRRVEGELKAEFKTVRVEIGSVRNEMCQMDKRRVFCLPIAAVDRTKHIGQAPDGLVRLVGILVALLRKLIARELPSGQFLDALEQGIPPLFR